MKDISNTLVFIFIFLFVSFSINGEGFTADTLVKIPFSYCSIKELKQGDLVISYDFDAHKLTESKILNVYNERIYKYIRVFYNGNFVGISLDQKFYLFKINKWVNLQDIQSNHYLLKIFQEDFDIKTLEIVEQPIEIFKLTIENTNNFFITENNILVHNFIPVIGLSIVFGEGAAIASAAIGSAILSGLIFHNKKHDLPGLGDDWVKLRGDQGWRDAEGNRWKKDQLHKDHWDISDDKGNKIREVDFEGNEIWPNGPKNKNKKP